MTCFSASAARRRGGGARAAAALAARPGAGPRPRRAVAGRAAAADAEPPAVEGVPIEQSSTSFEAVMDIDAVMKVLPHRYPFLLVDRIVEYEQGKTAVAVKNVTMNEQFFTGHFPQRPIMPGVLMVEAMAQVGGIAMMDPDDPKENFFFGGIDKCKFRKPVTPGDTLMIRATLKKMNKRFGVAKMDAKCYVGGAVVSEAELTLYMGN